jgi:UDP-N-acetylglucosamine--dolichyl-phosphate N-acetylglucosaminephosphotransferase
MVDASLILASVVILATAIVTIFLVKLWMRAARSFGLVGKDMNKFEKKEIPEAGGVAVVFSIVFGILAFVFFKTFLLQTATHFVELFAIALTILLAGFLGFIDDILGWKKGLKQWQKPLLTIPIAIPLAVLNAGHSTIGIPFLGNIDFGLLFPLAIIPVAIVGAANGFNILAGMNGLEAGMGAIILGTLSIILFNSNTWLSLVSAIATVALIGFWLFNKYPARVFPGNSLTYSIGAIIGILAAIGDVTKAGLVLFVPYFIELIIKAKNKFKTECFGVPYRDGRLCAPKKVGSLTHIFMNVFKTEKRTVAGLLSLEVFLALLVIFIQYV